MKNFTLFLLVILGITTSSVLEAVTTRSGKTNYDERAVLVNLVQNFEKNSRRNRAVQKQAKMTTLSKKRSVSKRSKTSFPLADLTNMDLIQRDSQVMPEPQSLLEENQSAHRENLHKCLDDSFYVERPGDLFNSTSDQSKDIFF